MTNARYESGKVENPTLCCKCDKEWDGEITVDEEDWKGNPIELPICLECHKEELVCAEWVGKVLNLK